MRRTRARHVGRSVKTGATTPNRNGLVMCGLLSKGRMSGLSMKGVDARPAPPGARDLDMLITRIGPQLPHALRRCIELSFDSHRERLWILVDGDDRHWSVSFVSE